MDLNKIVGVDSFPVYKQVGWEADSNDKIPYLFLTVLFTCFVYTFETYLDLRQLQNFRNIKNLPKALIGFIPDEKFVKANAYGADKIKFGRIESSFMVFEGIVLILFGWLPYIWDISSMIAVKWNVVTESSSPLFQEIAVTSIFVVIMICHDTIISFPFSFYFTFVVEEKHGFNKQTVALFLRDKVVSLALGLVIGVPVLGCVIWLIRLGGPHFYFYVWSFLLVFTLFMMMIYPTVIAPLFNTFKPIEEGPIYSAIEGLAAQVKFPLTKIFEVDGSTRSAHSNAYFYGFFKSKRIVIFDTLIKQVELPELLAIVGHEIGHWQLSHTLQGFFISQSYIFCLFLVFSFVQNSTSLFLSFGFACSKEYSMPVFIGLTLFSQSIWSPVDKTLQFILNINSRRNEFAADKYAKDLGMGSDLAKGLVKISIENLGNMVPDHMYSTYHFSHPPVVERIAAIQTPSRKGDKKSN